MIKRNLRDGTLIAAENTGSFRTQMLSKVPEVTLYFWVIKVLCTTVGETASDYLNINLGLGLRGTSIAMGLCLAVAIFFQFKAKKYIPSIYWLVVVLVSVFGTLVTDILTDSLGVPLEISTTVFSIVLAIVFGFWYAEEKTLSIHSIVTRRREAFYWLSVLITFALGTAAGDLMAESLGLGYLVTGIIVCTVVVIITVAWRLKLDAVLAFWIIYILTRPLGASLGDYLTQSHANGGLGLGASVTTAAFTIAILAAVIFLTVTRRDYIPTQKITDSAEEKRPILVWQLVVVVGVLVIAAGSGYHWRHSYLQHQAAAHVSTIAPLGDLTAFRKITENALSLVKSGDVVGSKARAGDLEFAWDNAEARLRAMSPKDWTTVDDAIDQGLKELRSRRQDTSACVESLDALIRVLNELDKPL